MTSKAARGRSTGSPVRINGHTLVPTVSQRPATLANPLLLAEELECLDLVQLGNGGSIKLIALCAGVSRFADDNSTPRKPTNTREGNTTPTQHPTPRSARHTSGALLSHLSYKLLEPVHVQLTASRLSLLRHPSGDLVWQVDLHQMARIEAWEADEGEEETRPRGLMLHTKREETAALLCQYKPVLSALHKLVHLRARHLTRHPVRQLGLDELPVDYRSLSRTGGSVPVAIHTSSDEGSPSTPSEPKRTVPVPLPIPATAVQEHATKSKDGVRDSGPPSARSHTTSSGSERSRSIGSGVYRSRTPPAIRQRAIERDRAIARDRRANEESKASGWLAEQQRRAAEERSRRSTSQGKPTSPSPARVLAVRAPPAAVSRPQRQTPLRPSSGSPRITTLTPVSRNSPTSQGKPVVPSAGVGTAPRGISPTVVAQLQEAIVRSPPVSPHPPVVPPLPIAAIAGRSEAEVRPTAAPASEAEDSNIDTSDVTDAAEELHDAPQPVETEPPETAAPLGDDTVTVANTSREELQRLIDEQRLDSFRAFSIKLRLEREEREAEQRKLQQEMHAVQTSDAEPAGQPESSES